MPGGLGGLSFSGAVGAKLVGAKLKKKVELKRQQKLATNDMEAAMKQADEDEAKEEQIEKVKAEAK